MAKYLTSVYVSGWQCSSTASTSNEPGPDVADYPYDTVPNKAWDGLGWSQGMGAEVLFWMVIFCCSNFSFFSG